MNIMNEGIHFKVIWLDENVIELSVTCSNGRFSGSVDLYTDHFWSSQFAEAIGDFPTSLSDEREVELGAWNEKLAGGRIRLKFFCADNLGHLMITVNMCSDSSRGNGQTETAFFQIPAEVAEVDEFVKQLENLKVQVGSTIFLASPPYLA